MSFALPASMGLTDILSLAIAAILVNNYILVQFLGCCSFFGVSKKTDTDARYAAFAKAAWR